KLYLWTVPNTSPSQHNAECGKVAGAVRMSSRCACEGARSVGAVGGVVGHLSLMDVPDGEHCLLNSSMSPRLKRTGDRLGEGTELPGFIGGPRRRSGQYRRRRCHGPQGAGVETASCGRATRYL